MPLHFPADFDLGFSREATQTLKSGKFTIAYLMPKNQLIDRQAIRLSPGIPTADGLWFLASIATDEDIGVSVEGILNENEASESGLERLRNRVAEMVATFPQLD